MAADLRNKNERLQDENNKLKNQLKEAQKKKTTS